MIGFFFFSQLRSSVVSGVLYVAQLPHTKLLYIPKYFEVNRNKKVILQKVACVCVSCVCHATHMADHEKSFSLLRVSLMSHSESESRPVGGLSAQIHTTESGKNGLRHLNSVQCMLLSR